MAARLSVLIAVIVASVFFASTSLASLGVHKVSGPQTPAETKFSCPVDDNGNCVRSCSDPDCTQGDGYQYGDSAEGYEEYYSDGSRCNTVWARRNYNTWFGTNLWRYYEEVHWCWAYGFITTFQRYRWPDINSAPWRWDGNIASNCADETCTDRSWASYTGTTVMTRGQFHACAPPYDWACNYQYPTVYIGVNGYGGWGYSTSG
jgi:hypothetical protein